MNPIWQYVIIPLVTVLLTAAMNWLANHHVIRRQRNDRLCALLQSGQIEQVHPLVIKMAVDEAYGVRVPVDANALRFALQRQADGEKVLRAFLSARDLVRFNPKTRRFEDARRGAHLLSSFRRWQWMAFAGGILSYFFSLILMGLSHNEGNAVGVILSFLISLLFIPAGIIMSIVFGNAQALIDLQPEEVTMPAVEDGYLDIPAFHPPNRD